MSLRSYCVTLLMLIVFDTGNLQLATICATASTCIPCRRISPDPEEKGKPAMGSCADRSDIAPPISRDSARGARINEAHMGRRVGAAMGGHRPLAAARYALAGGGSPQKFNVGEVIPVSPPALILA